MGIIYEIVDLTMGERYIGSTTQTKERRLNEHISSYKRFKNGKYHFVTSFIIIEKNNYEMNVLEETEYLLEREGYFIRTLECVNKVIPTRTRIEYRQDNKDKIDKYQKEKRKEKFTCICGSILRKSDKARHEKSTKHNNFLNDS